PVLSAPLPPRLTRLLARLPPAAPALAHRSPRRREKAGHARIVAAASLSALLLGLGASWWLHAPNGPLRPAGDHATDGMTAAFSGALYEALDRGRPGESFAYTSAQAGISGRIVIVGELPTRSGLSCREFSHLVEHGAAPLAQHGVACRAAGGGWETITLPAPSP